MKNFLRREEGYTLAEAIVAIGILSTALLGTLVLAVQSINVTDIANAKTQAEFLAEEGIELTRAFREDSAGAFVSYDPSAGCPAGSCAPVSYASIVTKIPTEGNTIRINIDSKKRVCENDTNCYPLYVNSQPDQDGRYVMRPGTNTRFKRTLTLTRKKDSSGNLFIQVKSQVDYTAHGIAQPANYTLTTDLYDWM